jgi:transcription initiation factor TFIIIB Brf1 subunit/transcription initiation factor TFIIB
MSLCCPNCSSTDIETDAARGDAVCIQCGTVIEENAIVNEVTFAQDAGGGSSVVGQFVAASSGLGFGKESREVAFSNGQRHISQLAQALRLAEHHQEAAQRLFMLAVQHNFIQGRRTQHVIAACLYTVCRREKTPHLLIDFSDVLQTNVYMLGSCFLKFTRLLSLALPIIDPSLYIQCVLHICVAGVLEPVRVATSGGSPPLAGRHLRLAFSLHPSFCALLRRCSPRRRRHMRHHPLTLLSSAAASRRSSSLATRLTSCPCARCASCSA